jgi:hypothetical protein
MLYIPICFFRVKDSILITFQLVSWLLAFGMLMFRNAVICNETKWKITISICLFPSWQWSCRTLKLEIYYDTFFAFCVSMSICFLGALVFMYVFHGYGALKSSLIFKMFQTFVFSFFRLALYIFFLTIFLFF